MESRNNDDSSGKPVDFFPELGKSSRGKPGSIGTPRRVIERPDGFEKFVFDYDKERKLLGYLPPHEIQEEPIPAIESVNEESKQIPPLNSHDELDGARMIYTITKK